MYDLLEEELDEVKLAHPYKVKAIAEARIKTDKIDSKILAHLLRSNLIPEAYVPSKIQGKEYFTSEDVFYQVKDNGKEQDIYDFRAPS
jgi:hypothetical protein